MTDLPDKNQRNINGIPLDGGVHDCHWVFKGKYTNPLVTRNKVGPGFSRDWNSKQRCGLSLLGTIHCSGFTFMEERHHSTPYKFIRVKRKSPKELRQVIKMILCGEFTGIGEELVDNIEEDILEAVGMELKGGGAE